MKIVRNTAIKIFSFLSSIMFLACSESDFDGGTIASLKASYLNIHPSQYNFASSLDTQGGEVTSLNAQWSIQSTSSWLSYSQMAGVSNATIQLSVLENQSADTIRTTIDFLCSADPNWNFKVPINVSQNMASPQITSNHTSLEFDGKSSTQIIEITSNFNWSAISQADWISLKKNDSKLHITVKENNTGNKRSSYVDISGKSHLTIRINQLDANVVVSEKSLLFGNTAGTIKLAVEADAQWTASTSDYWIQISPSSGTSGKSSLEVSVSPNESENERNGWLYINVGSQTIVTIPVKQKGLYIEPEVSSVEFVSSGGTQNLKLKSNVSWIVSSQPEWLTVSPLSGKGDTELSLRASDNNSITSRHGRIMLSCPGVNLDRYINVLQSGKQISISTNSLDFSDRAGTQSIDITSDGTWEASTNTEWITLSPAKKRGSGKLTVEVSENNADSDRNGSFTISLIDKAYNVNVRQQGKYFVVADDDMNFTSAGGTLQLNISTNDDWSAKLLGNAKWLTLSQYQGMGKVTLNITATDNPSVNERQDFLVVETKNGQNVKVKLYQAARYLKASTKSVMFFSRGGTSELITIDTDGKYEISSDVSWFNISKNGDSFTVTTPPNTTERIREGKITIRLTDLQEGEMYLVIPVIQIAPGAKFDKQGYSEEVDWSASFDGGVTVNVTGYNNDKILDDTDGKAFILVIKGYTGDKWWGEALDGKEILSKYGYNSDKSQDDKTKGNGSFDKTVYDSDANRDSNNSSKGNMTKDKYKDDKNLDN